jgi:Protein of unknown function (DUF3352)
MIRERLRGVRYLFDDLGYALGRLPRRIRGEDVAAEDEDEAAPAGGEATRRRWLLPVLGGLAALAVTVGVVAAVAGGGNGPQSDDAIALVPADALAYVHADLDPESEQYEQAAALAERLPLVSRQVVRLLSGLVATGEGSAHDFEEDIGPWFGGELGLALVPTGARPELVQLLEVADEARAREYGGEDAAIVDGFLVIGANRVVEAVTATARDQGAGPSLADDPAVEEARERLPEERLADAFLSEAGVDELVADPSASLATVEPFVDAGATLGVGAAVVATEDGFELEIRSVLDPERSSSDPGFFDAFPGFEPSLTSDVPPNVLAYLGFGDPEETIEALLRQASIEAPGLAAAFSDLFERLREAGDVSLRGDLLPALGEEAALVLDLVREAGAGQPEIPGLVPEPLPGQPPPVVPQQPTPLVELIAGGVDEEQAESALSELEEPLTEALGIDLAYEVFDSKLVVATSPTAVERVAEGEGGLDQDERYQRATEGLADELSLVAYLSVSRLLELAELAGLAEDPAYVTFADDLHQLEALGVGVEASPEELATDARLVIGEEQRERDPIPPVPDGE